jgi:transcriptional regulator with XRE-family HTH domain
MPQPKPDPVLAVVIRSLREQRGISLEKLAYQAQITTGSLSRIELAQSAPGWSTVRQIAEALDLPLARIAAVVEAVEERS